MANWLTPELLSKKCGISESTLRSWKCLGYIVSSTIDNEVLLDEDSLNRYLDAHKSKELSINYLEKIIKEKELEKEALLAQFDDEPISRVAARHQMTYGKTLETYKSILKNLENNTNATATLLRRRTNSVFSQFSTAYPTRIELFEILPFYVYRILSTEAKIKTVSDLLKYTSKRGWKSLQQLRGIGFLTYARIIKELAHTNFIIADKDGNIELSPEMAVLMNLP